MYLRHGDEFVAMREQPYEAEDLLQALIADHPEVLAGDEQDDRRAWLLVRREAGVADTDDGGERWSLDHLFLDQEGVPTLVEVKRSSDTRARREVVAQMLDYAANATAHWKVESLRAWFEAQCDRQGVDHLAALDSAFGVTEEDAYWETVRKNLASDRIRLVFVADEIAPELRSISPSSARRRSVFHRNGGRPERPLQSLRDRASCRRQHDGRGPVVECVSGDAQCCMGRVCTSPQIRLGRRDV